MAFAAEADSLDNDVMESIKKTVRGFSKVDTNYIEPQKYNFTVMLQNTNNYEVYRMKSRSGRTITFAPAPSIKLGPYFGWRWIFLGYTIDVKHFQSDETKQDFSLSLYSNQIGVDLFYRKTGSDYKIRRINLKNGLDLSSIKNAPFDGVRSSVKGFNFYYIFNHRKFSYPAAFSQSTVQRRSAGSFLAGIGYTQHRLNTDWGKLDTLISERLGMTVTKTGLDTTMRVGQVSYEDFSLSAGYAYNWVFAYNWLFSASASVALSYKHTVSDNEYGSYNKRDFDLKSFMPDGIVRFALVWNNMRWYAGAGAVFNYYNFSREDFSTNNMFGSLNLYFGYNFGLKDHSRKKKKG